MHGITRKINTKATLIIKKGKLSAESSFNVKLEDYKIATDAGTAAVVTVNAAF
jgi:hypothetical protein